MADALRRVQVHDRTRRVRNDVDIRIAAVDDRSRNTRHLDGGTRNALIRPNQTAKRDLARRVQVDQPVSSGDHSPIGHRDHARVGSTGIDVNHPVVRGHVAGRAKRHVVIRTRKRDLTVNARHCGVDRKVVGVVCVVHARNQSDRVGRTGNAHSAADRQIPVVGADVDRARGRLRRAAHNQRVVRAVDLVDHDVVRRAVRRGHRAHVRVDVVSVPDTGRSAQRQLVRSDHSGLPAEHLRDGTAVVRAQTIRVVVCGNRHITGGRNRTDRHVLCRRHRDVAARARSRRGRVHGDIAVVRSMTRPRSTVVVVNAGRIDNVPGTRSAHRNSSRLSDVMPCVQADVPVPARSGHHRIQRQVVGKGSSLGSQEDIAAAGIDHCRAHCQRAARGHGNVVVRAACSDGHAVDRTNRCERSCRRVDDGQRAGVRNAQVPARSGRGQFAHSGLDRIRVRADAGRRRDHHRAVGLIDLDVRRVQGRSPAVPGIDQRAVRARDADLDVGTTGVGVRCDQAPDRDVLVGAQRDQASAGVNDRAVGNRGNHLVVVSHRDRATNAVRIAVSVSGNRHIART